MQVEFDLNKDDYWQYNLYISFKRKSTYCAFNMLIVMFCGLFFLWQGLKRGSFIEMLAVVVLGFMLLFVLIKTSVYLAAANSKSTLGHYKISINEDGITENTEYRITKTSWKGIFDVTSDRSNLYLFFDNNFAHIVPKRSFVTPEDVLKFEKLSTVYWTGKDLPEGIEASF